MYHPPPRYTKYFERRLPGYIKVRVYPDLEKRIVYNTARSPRTAKGRTTQLNREAYFAFLFEINEALPKDRKLTDFQIAKAVVYEFWHVKQAHRLLEKPEKCRYNLPRWGTIARWRSRYNRGLLVRTPDGVPHRSGPVSFRYDLSGNRVSQKSERKVLTPGEVDAILVRYSSSRAEQDAFEREVQDGCKFEYQRGKREHWMRVVPTTGPYKGKNYNRIWQNGREAARRGAPRTPPYDASKQDKAPSIRAFIRAWLRGYDSIKKGEDEHGRPPASNTSPNS